MIVLRIWQAGAGGFVWPKPVEPSNSVEQETEQQRGSSAPLMGDQQSYNPLCKEEESREIF